MKLISLAILLFMVPTLASAQIYKWVDDKGKLHYGDRPPETQQKNVENVDVNVNVVKAQSPPPTFTPYTEPARHKKPKVASVPAPSTNRVKREEEECAAAWKSYNDSKKCFDRCSTPIMTANPNSYGFRTTYRVSGMDISSCHCQNLKKPQCFL